MIPVLISWLLNLSPHLHSMVRIGLHQRFGREQTEVSNKGGKKHQRLLFNCALNIKIFNSLIKGYIALIKKEHAVDKLTKAERAS